MALVVVWMLTALVILATVCIGVFKGILGDSVLFSRGPRDFLLDRLARYGDPFTMSMMGRTYTVISSPETVKFVLSTAHASFSGAYPVQYSRLLSPDRYADLLNECRRIILSASSGDELQKKVPFISSFAEKTVKSWENQAVVNSVEESHKFALALGMRTFWRDVEPGSKEMEQIRNEVSRVTEGLVALPINFPGFSFHKAMKAKQVLVSRIQSAISKRRKAGIQQDDVLNALMSITAPVEVPDYDISCVMIGMVYAISASTASLIPWVLKYLDDFPEVRQRVQDEQDCLRQKMIEDKSMTWFKPRSSMPYTLQVLYEILRIETIAMITPRQADKDIDINGLVFRKGSYVWPSSTSIHYDPKYYPNPWKFDPSRFVERPNSNTFLAFGQGPHLCPGSDFALTETMFIIHHLITNYSWERCGPNEGVIHFPFRKLASFPIRLVKRCMT